MTQEKKLMSLNFFFQFILRNVVKNPIYLKKEVKRRKKTAGKMT